ncbi:MAG: ABC transporter permease [Alphaproteobacteria bacterium]
MRTRAAQRRLGLAVLFGGPLAWTTLFLIIPYAIMLAISFWARKFPTYAPDFQFGNYLQIFGDPQYSRVLLRTLRIAALVSLAALALGYPLAYFLVFTVRSTRLRALLYFAVIVPLWVSYLLRAYTWKIILGTDGVLNGFLVWAGILEQPSTLLLYSQFAMIVTLTYVFIPFTVMPIYTALERIPHRLIEASEDLGAGPFMTFVRVVLPLSRRGVIAGGTLTFCLTFGDFLAPQLVGGPDGTMVANLIQAQFGSALNWPLGSAFAMVILVLVVAVIALSERSEGAERLELA